MFGLEALDVGIGMALLFLFASLLATAVREMIEAKLKTRAADLERGIMELLSHPDDLAKGADSLVKDFYEHPLIASLYKGTYENARIPSGSARPKPNSGTNAEPASSGTVSDGTPLASGEGERAAALPQTSGAQAATGLKKSPLGPRGGDLPSYIPARNFSGAVLDIVARGRDFANAVEARGGATLSVDDLRASVGNIENPRVQRAILSALDTSQGDIEQVRRSLESWYDGTMDRVSGWYKRRTQSIVFWIGLATAVLLNIDALTVYSRLTADKTLRASVVSTAADLKLSAEPSEQESSLKALRAQVKMIGLPIGWSTPFPQTENGYFDPRDSKIWHAVQYFLMLFGWLITAFAVTLGAPFWFDVLNKFMIVRSTVKPAEKSKEAGSEDRQDVAMPNAGRRPPERGDPAPASGTLPQDETTPRDGTASVALATNLLASYPFEPRAWQGDDPQRGIA